MRFHKQKFESQYAYLFYQLRLYVRSVFFLSLVNYFTQKERQTIIIIIIYSISSSYYKYICRMLQRLNLLFIIIQCIQLINFIDGYNNIKYSLKNNLCMSINKGNNYFIRFYYNFPYAV